MGARSLATTMFIKKEPVHANPLLFSSPTHAILTKQAIREHHLISRKASSDRSWSPHPSIVPCLKCLNRSWPPRPPHECTLTKYRGPTVGADLSASVCLILLSTSINCPMSQLSCHRTIDPHNCHMSQLSQSHRISSHRKSGRLLYGLLLTQCPISPIMT